MSKKKGTGQDTVKARSYTIVLERESDGRYSVYAPDLPGCATWGDTRSEAIKNVREAVECYLAALRKLGKRAPRALAKVEVLRVAAA